MGQTYEKISRINNNSNTHGDNSHDYQLTLSVITLSHMYSIEYVNKVNAILHLHYIHNDDFTTYDIMQEFVNRML